MNMKQTAAEVKRHITCKDILSYHGVQYAGSNIRCPLPDHEDQNPSFGLYDDARKFKCHGCDRGGDCIELERLIAGCQPGEAIKRLAEKTGLRTEGHAKTMVAAYDYHNETGKLVFQVVRYEPKDFRQRKPDGHGGWVWNIKGITPPLFRLSGVRSAIAAEETVYICEGEKDVETLVSFGLTATTNAGGANKWADRYTDEFRDADVILVPDTDEAGQKHALKLAESLQGVAKVLRILSIPKGKDVSEWVESGGSPDQFAALVTNAQIVTPALMEELRNQVGEEIDPRQLEKEFDTQLSDVWFDGKWYWRKIRDAYEPFSRLDTKLWVVNELGIPGGKREDSQAHKALLYIQTHNRVAGAVPFLFRASGPLTLDSKRYLNTSDLRPVKPTDTPRSWGEGFPEIRAFYERLFDTKSREVYLTWLQHFYAGAVKQSPRQGHALVIVGDPGCGKGFQSEIIAGPLVGGSVDAGAFITGADTYTRSYLGSPLLRVDDEAGIETRTEKRRYIATLKRLVANRRFVVSEKYLANSHTEWMGRIIITLNPDGESLALLPSLDQGNRDKVCFLKTTEQPMPHPPENYPSVLAEELPCFARWLLDWQPPEWLKPGGRFGFEAYHDPELLQESEHNSDGAQFEELLIIFAQKCTSDDTWEGTATELHAAICGEDSLRPQIQKASPSYVGRQLGKLKDRNYLTKLRRNLSRGWSIDLAKLRECA